MEKGKGRRIKSETGKRSRQTGKSRLESGKENRDKSIVNNSTVATIDFIISLLRAFVQDCSWEEERVDLNRVDWDQFFRIARYHRLAGVVYHTAKLSPLFPMQRIEKWRPAMIRNNAIYIQKQHRLLQIVAELKAIGVQATPFKGFVLASLLYSEPAVRPTTDFDLYIPKWQAEKTVRCFIEQGYKSPYFEEKIPAAVFKKSYSVELVHPRRKEYIDLHWELTDGYATLPFSADELDKRMIALPFENDVIRCFDDFVTATLIAVHGAKNSWAQLFSLLDLALFFRCFPDFDYSELLQRLHSRGIARMLLVGSALVHQLGLAAPPDAILDGVDQSAKRIAGLIRGGLFASPLSASPHGWKKVALNMGFRERYSTKLSYLWFKALPKKVDIAASSEKRAFLARVRRILGLS